MRAIEREKHQRFCKMIKEFKLSLALEDNNLTLLESELDEIFTSYQHSLNEVRSFIMKYDLKQKDIRQKLRLLMRDELSRKKV